MFKFGADNAACLQEQLKVLPVVPECPETARSKSSSDQRVAVQVEALRDTLPGGQRQNGDFECIRRA